MISGKPCLGCGTSIETDQKLCERCFKLKNYGEINIVDFNNEEYIENLVNTISKKDLVILVLDVLNLPNDINEYIKDIKASEIIIVLTKIDLLPKSVKLDKLKAKFELETIPVSSFNKYNLDRLYKRIINYKGFIYLIGNANAGKSTLINQLLASYSKTDPIITTSHLAGTTLDYIKIKLTNDVTLVDTPGILDNDDISLFLDKKLLKTIIPKSEIRPKTYQVKKDTGFSIKDILRLEYMGDDNSLTFYVSNNLKVDHINIMTNIINNEFTNHSFKLDYNQDIVIRGLGFIKVTRPGDVNIFVPKSTNVYVRDNLI